MTLYMPDAIMSLIENISDQEFNDALWIDDPDMDIDARAYRDEELVLDLTGNLDSFTVEVRDDENDRSAA